MSKDLDELTSLNRDYVASVQNCDVKRFDEILSPEFYCSNPDKSFVDRAGFLKQTALPITIKGLVATDVKIRIMGDFAIVHGATSKGSLGDDSVSPVSAETTLVTAQRSPATQCGTSLSVPPSGV